MTMVTMTIIKVIIKIKDMIKVMDKMARLLQLKVKFNHKAICPWNQRRRFRWLLQKMMKKRNLKIWRDLVTWKKEQERWPVHRWKINLMMKDLISWMKVFQVIKPTMQNLEEEKLSPRCTNVTLVKWSWLLWDQKPEEKVPMFTRNII